MQVYKTLIATLKNTPSHYIHNGGQNQKPPDGNCLLLDDGETHTCVQLISKYHIFCNHFKDAVLPLDKELYREMIFGNDYKRCQSCGSRFYSKARNKRYCDKCADRIKRQKSAERKRRQRERQKQLLYINN